MTTAGVIELAEQNIANDFMAHVHRALTDYAATVHALAKERGIDIEDASRLLDAWGHHQVALAILITEKNAKKLMTSLPEENR